MTSEDKVVGCVVLLLVLIVLLPFAGCMGAKTFGWFKPDYSTGERLGTIQKFSKKGLFWKSWEGEMVLSSFSTTDKGQMNLDKFEFSVPVEDIQVVAQVQSSMEQSAKHKIKYRQYFIGPWKYNTRSIAIEAAPVKQ